MTTNYRHEIVGVFGDPVDENPAILMFEAAFKAKGLRWRYQNFHVRAEDLGAAMAGIRAMRFRGINLTLPHKIAGLRYLDRITPEAALIGAVNTIVRDGDALIGANTDGKGFLMALKLNANLDPTGKRVVVLGAGGAARAIAVELALAGVRRVTIANRTAQRGEALAQLINDKTSAQAEFAWWRGDYTLPEDTDIVVNATGIGLFPHMDDKPGVNMDSIKPGMLVCDVVPHPPRTRFLIEATAKGAKTLDGLGMLVYQGAIAFTIWTGQDAPVDVMRQALAEVFA
ncbi:MAG: shikimate dehydrogenase [Chloroflexi bacterium]|jgi:shikimate dehydrogenase|uniref:shikimate dehydrogenase n=1 Tax=Candidatus Roseilinea sp. NK_OTU-006 TaxID=2704250 RepID=UPI000F27B760|nr:shikimate dehydrogenase [Candidatus Roseilinea sp. NK_OTU-006]RMG63912.1 MAG: shikimate dehydrogenase [Chloroflexota bacterium]